MIHSCDTTDIDLVLRYHYMLWYDIIKCDKNATAFLWSFFFFKSIFFLILCIKRTLHILVECKFSDTTKSVIIFSDGQGCNFSHTIRTNEIMLYFAIKTSNIFIRRKLKIIVFCLINYEIITRVQRVNKKIYAPISITSLIMIVYSLITYTWICVSIWIFHARCWRFNLRNYI